MEEELRPAELVLHEKVGGKKRCVCDSAMRYMYRNGWVCNRQYELGEPNSIIVYLKSDRNAIFQLFGKKKVI